jgi:hypothetical protein
MEQSAGDRAISFRGAASNRPQRLSGAILGGGHRWRRHPGCLHCVVDCEAVSPIDEQTGMDA